MARLRRTDCSGKGIHRVRRGRGFAYVGSSREPVTDSETLERIRELVIPPAWRDVWICPYPNGHLQAVGSDAAGRKQYLYHQDWRRRRDQEKFDHMIEFARRLPRIRSATSAHLARRGFSQSRVLACAVRLLDRGFFRIGTEDYAEQNQTYGLATMRKRHVALSEGGVVTFDYRAKSGKRRIESVVDQDVYKVVAALKRRAVGGEELLAYKRGADWFDVKSSDINSYIKEIAGAEFTAKDFRTWSATVLAAVALAVSGPAAASPTARKRAESRTVQEVAHYLGNTPAVCRASYIDPRVFDRFRAGVTVAGALEELGDVEAGQRAIQGPIELAVLDLLQGVDSEALEQVEELAS
ncbi:MAG TPA: DNA topoisomerase IB [Actinomycetota bacterium]|nr:DNA topoisomerase IB [Actinomycetota bacterium]